MFQVGKAHFKIVLSFQEIQNCTESMAISEVFQNQLFT